MLTLCNTILLVVLLAVTIVRPQKVEVYYKDIKK